MDGDLNTGFPQVIFLTRGGSEIVPWRESQSSLGLNRYPHRNRVFKIGARMPMNRMSLISMGMLFTSSWQMPFRTGSVSVGGISKLVPSYFILLKRASHR